VTLLNVLALVVLLAVVGFVVGKWLFQKDESIEDRRRVMLKLANVLSGLGLVKIPEFLIDYGVGDYSGMLQKGKAVIDTFASGEEAVLKEFSKIFENVLTAQLKTDAGRALIAAKLTDAVKSTDPSVVKDAPAAGVI
jgi:hypothetical protein